MNINSQIAHELNISLRNVSNTVELLNEGATIPFISRYRKEKTGSLDEVQVGDIKSSLEKWTEFLQRKEFILKTIDDQGKLTPELKKRIEETLDPILLEDLYLPYKKKRKTRGTKAIEQGLEPLATLIFEQKLKDPISEAKNFLNETITDTELAIQGAKDIIAEWINVDEKVRALIRNSFEKTAYIYSKVARGKKDDGIKYKDYFEFNESLKKCPSHRILAMLRGENEGVLRISILPDEENLLYKLKNKILTGQGKATQLVGEALEDSYDRLLQPSIETEFRKLAKEKADKEAIEVFTNNLRQLLLASPIGQKGILALDPGFRTGCKVICIDSNGNLLENTTIYPHPPQNKMEESADIIHRLVNKHQPKAIAIGDGTAGRETMQFINSINLDKSIQRYMVNEDGASIYSASKVARAEFPNYDVTVRGAISIGRRLQDPLAELVKIDAKSIGVGQYQHDVNQKLLQHNLDTVVESCVNAVGINLNTASEHLLNYVSGLGPVLSKNIIQYRNENGSFTKRTDLKKVPRLGDKAFQQAAGFMRIKNGKNTLDNTSIHPETYHIVKQMATDLGCNLKEFTSNKELILSIDLNKYTSEKFGLPTLKDIIKDLLKPGLDPRGEAKPIDYDNRLSSINDIALGMIIKGVVTNITNFGAFIDIGIKEKGLLHISQITNRFIKSPAEVLKLRQEITVKVIDVDLDRKRISLSKKQIESN